VITRILSEGARAGIHLITTGDRSLLAGRIAALCEDKLVFKLAEKDDYALAGLPLRDLPADIRPGRAFQAVTGTETQVALLLTGAAPAAPRRRRRNRRGADVHRPVSDQDVIGYLRARQITHTYDRAPEPCRQTPRKP